jgi:hypothetical protein
MVHREAKAGQTAQSLDLFFSRQDRLTGLFIITMEAASWYSYTNLIFSN